MHLTGEDDIVFLKLNLRNVAVEPITKDEYRFLSIKGYIKDGKSFDF